MDDLYMNDQSTSMSGVPDIANNGKDIPSTQIQQQYDQDTGLPILQSDRKMLSVFHMIISGVWFMSDLFISDLVFIQDCTGSQGSYISSATRNIEEICATIFASGKLQDAEDMRVGLIAFRDHPPQDHTYVTRKFDFTSDIRQVHDSLKTLYASGGGDGPEAVTAALWETLNMDWRGNASKMVVLIADAPPHGIGDYGDGLFLDHP
jgi:hypothetical protein